jgi:hypothetical protein
MILRMLAAFLQAALLLFARYALSAQQRQLP